MQEEEHPLMMKATSRSKIHNRKQRQRQKAINYGLAAEAASTDPHMVPKTKAAVNWGLIKQGGW
jgi:hypothetical protein